MIFTPYFYLIKKYGTWAHLHHGKNKWLRLFFKILTYYIYENWWFSYWYLRFFELLLEHYRGMNWLDQQTTLLHTLSPFGSFLECYFEMSCAKGWLSISMVSSLLKYDICKWVQPRWKCHLDKFSKLEISLFIPFMKLYVQVLDGLLSFLFLLVIDLKVLYIYICNCHKYYLCLLVLGIWLLILLVSNLVNCKRANFLNCCFQIGLTSFHIIFLSYSCLLTLHTCFSSYILSCCSHNYYIFHNSLL